MRISQCHTVLNFFRQSVFDKYGLRQYHTPNSPAVFWGMYPSSRRRLLSHKAIAVVVWRGSDAMNVVKDKSFLKWLVQQRDRIFHVAISNFIQDDLTRYGLPFVSLPLTSMDYSMCHVMPRGDMLYTYGADNDGALIKYQMALAKEVSKKTGIRLLICKKEDYTREQLVSKIYSRCFVGLRLLDHDGLSNSVVELGLCGREVIWNGNTPNAIHWQNENDIIASVMDLYQYRKTDNTHIAKAMSDYINVDQQWLNTEYWELKCLKNGGANPNDLCG